MPPEHELASQLGGSRTVVREAIRTLTAMHMVEVQRGIGTIVARPTAHLVARSMTLSMTLFLRGLYHHRRIFEQVANGDVQRAKAV